MREMKKFNGYLSSEVRRVEKFVKLSLDGWKREEGIRRGGSVFVLCFVR